MTTYTLAEARDTIIGVFEDRWVNNAGLSLDDIYYQNRRADEPDHNRVWCKFNLTNTAFNPDSLTSINNVRIFERNAIMIIGLRFPLDEGIDDITTQAVLDIFEGGISSVSGIFFRNVTATELGVVGNWFRTNITAEITYNQVK